MRPFGILIGATFGILALTALVYLNDNYEFATGQIQRAGPYAGKMALMVLALLSGIAALLISALMMIFRRTRPFAVGFVFAFFCVGGMASFLHSSDPALISGLLGLPTAV
ncbi:hypothetical protein [Jannaschia donghaensis]|uniref:Uncharacterized protein n=1 Tax=Jannaschia donghaensis TaxID=420998 RepID=A0A0M6YLL3_9RHOB|nr:hypothetical protein [Jannaschia donghaensis]CTQ49946.1 hypothetical protein JDO7802_01963 [Jannaschia donghaensis]